MRISDWSSDVCSSDLEAPGLGAQYALCRLRDLIFEDAAALEHREDQIIVETVHAAPGPRGIMRHQFLPRRPVAAIVERFFGNMVGETFVAYAVAEPGEVEQRIGDRGQLPVDQRGQPARRLEGEERVGG